MLWVDPTKHRLPSRLTRTSINNKSQEMPPTTICVRIVYTSAQIRARVQSSPMQATSSKLSSREHLHRCGGHRIFSVPLRGAARHVQLQQGITRKELPWMGGGFYLQSTSARQRNAASNENGRARGLTTETASDEGLVAISHIASCRVCHQLNTPAWTGAGYQPEQHVESDNYSGASDFSSILRRAVFAAMNAGSSCNASRNLTIADSYCCRETKISPNRRFAQDRSRFELACSNAD
jgi:hypothetical protein